MDIGALRRFGLTVAVDTHGVPATVTRPAPDNTPVSTNGFWLRERFDPQPYGTDLQRRQARKVFVLAREGALATSMPRGTTIAAPEVPGGSVRTWRADGFDEEVDPYCWRLILVLVA